VAEKKQSFEELQGRFRKLDKERAINAQRLADQEALLEELRREAREKWETDDVKKLQEKLDKMREENETRRETYQQELNAIESTLAKIKQEHSEAGA
jgi:hypothetical protein